MEGKEGKRERSKGDAMVGIVVEKETREDIIKKARRVTTFKMDLNDFRAAVWTLNWSEVVGDLLDLLNDCPDSCDYGIEVMPNGKFYLIGGPDPDVNWSYFAHLTAVPRTISRRMICLSHDDAISFGIVKDEEEQ